MKDIFMTNSTQRSDLVIQKVFLDFILDFGEFNDLDGYGLQCILIDSFENLWAKAWSDHVMWIVDKVFDFLC